MPQVLTWIDDAYARGKRGAKGVRKQEEGDRTIYEVPFKERFGYVGGKDGRRDGNPEGKTFAISHRWQSFYHRLSLLAVDTASEEHRVLMVDAWIYVGNCPICQCGLRRVRACTGSANNPSLHGYILCDDCETLWLEPDVHSPHQYPDSDVPACPVCQQPLFGPQARWATLQDVQTLGWQAQCIIEPVASSTSPEDLLDPDDLAIDLDSPEPPPVHHHDNHGNHELPAEQLAEVSSQLDRPDEAAEPKPGC